MPTHLLDNIPLGAFFFLSIVLALLCVELGFYLSKSRADKGVEESEKTVSSMVASTLGLLAFMLAFTFGVAAARFDDRRTLVVDEANAIETAFMRADLIQEPHRSKTKEILRKYVDIRVTGSKHFTLLELALRKSEELQDDLWQQAIAAAKEDNSDITALFVESINELVNLQSKRIATRIQARVPESIWGVLFLVSALSMIGMGYEGGLTGKRSWPAGVILVIAFSTVLVLIADLDRPWEGLLKVSQESMIDVGRRIGQPILH